MNWVGEKFCRNISTIPKLLHTKTQKYPHHRFRWKCKMAEGDGGHFLENRALTWGKIYWVSSSWYYALPVQKSLESYSWFVRYAQFILCAFCRKTWLKTPNQQGKCTQISTNVTTTSPLPQTEDFTCPLVKQELCYYL